MPWKPSQQGFQTEEVHMTLMSSCAEIITGQQCKTGGSALEEKSDQDHPQTVQITLYEFRLWPPHLVILLDLSYLQSIHFQIPYQLWYSN